MNKFKLSVGIFAFVGLAAINFTQSESNFVSKALASSSSGSSSNTSSNTNSSSSDDPYFVSWNKLGEESCPISKVNVTAGFVWGGVVIPIGGSYTVDGTKLDCSVWPFAKCDQRMITLCHEVQ